MRVVRHTPDVSPTPRLPTVELDSEADLGRCGALKDYWYVACRSTELPAGRPIARTLFGTPLVLFRGPSGAPAAMIDRCLHRNARLSAGAVFDGKLGCAYHGWTYDHSGACVEIPSLGPPQESQGLTGGQCASAGLCPRAQDVGRLRTFPVQEQDGLVYVFMGDPGSSPRRPPFRIPHAGEPGWCVYFMVTRFSSGVTPLVENFMDVPHTAFVHSGWFRKPHRRRVPATVHRTDGSVLVTYEEAKDALSGVGRLFNPRGLPMVHTDKFYVPNVTRVDYAFGDRGFAITSQCTPVGALETVVYTAISYRLPVDLPGALIARAVQPFIHWYTRQVIEQDVRIMEIQRDGLVSAGLQADFRSTEADLLHADIEAYRAWLREGATAAPPPDAERQIVFWV